ncbi:4497_t:CDS:2 [Gigaspora margarita]|uniref:4497_t:CDS:1 n=1 Tax=Gigaspora margarita TaxID=4874 RepID=A0ABM8W0S0_GIGMA|nr:4497_t:CDS:2 [Gigaspora margarita]
MISEKIKNTLYPKKAADGSEKVANSSKKVADGYDKLHKLYMSDAEGCNYSKLFTVSDNKLVLMRILDSENLSEKDLKNPSENDQKNLDENDPKNPNENYPNENDPVMIGIFDLETKKHYLPTSTQITIKVSQSAFMKNGDVIMIDFDASSVHILTPKKTQIKIGKTIEFFQLVYKSAMSFKRLPNTKVFVTPNEKLLIYDRSRFGSGSITKWDLKTSLFEAQFFLSNVYEVHDVKLNYNESLLLVYTTKYVEKKETNITVYLAGNGMKLVTYNLKTKIIDVFDIIASEFGERLLVISHEPHDDKSTNYELLDPYIDAESIKADKLFDVSSFDFKRPCIVTFSRIDRIDRIIGLIDEKLSIKKLIRKNWIKYLRKELKDYNRITIPSGGKIVGSMVKNIINDSNTLTSNKIDNLINGNLVEWTLTCGSGKALLRAKSLNISDERDINLDIWKNKQFLMQLNNDDLVIITRLHNDDLIIINVFIWTFKKKINNYIVHVNELIKKIESDEQKLSKKLYISPTLLDMIKRESNNEIQESDKLNKLQKEMEEIKMILNEIRNNKIENKNIEMEEIKTILNEIRNNKIENKNIENKTEN